MCVQQCRLSIFHNKWSNMDHVVVHTWKMQSREREECWHRLLAVRKYDERGNWTKKASVFIEYNFNRREMDNWVVKNVYRCVNHFLVVPAWHRSVCLYVGRLVGRYVRLFALVSVENAATFSPCVAVFHVFSWVLLSICQPASTHLRGRQLFCWLMVLLLRRTIIAASGLPAQLNWWGRGWVLGRMVEIICVCGKACEEM